MCGPVRSGFTLIELIIALAIIALLAAVTVPRFLSRGTAVLDDTVEQINRLTRAAYVRALITGKIHRVLFQQNDRAEMRLEVESGTTSSGALTFERVESPYIPTQYEWDKRIVIKNFFIKRIDEARGAFKEAWFFVFPIGLSQEIILNIVDEEARAQRGLVLNPFSVKFTVYDELQAP